MATPYPYFTHTPAYRQIETNVEELENTRLISEENGYAVCNATYSINFDANIHWKIQHTEKLVFSTNHTIVAEDDAIVAEDDAIVAEGEESLAFSPVDLSAQQLSDLCQDFGSQVDEENVAFSVNYAPHQLLQFNSEEYDGALVQRQFLVLVMCNVGRDQIGTYTCIASAEGFTTRREVSMDVSVFARETGRSTTVNIGAIIAVVIVAIVIIVVIFLLIYFGARRYRQLKYEAMQMRPMSIPLAATQLTNAINHAFASFSPIGSPMYDKFEFPRDNLMLLEVIGRSLSMCKLHSPTYDIVHGFCIDCFIINVVCIGEGQFGQVWRARAIGICSEDSRNIVAVKTLKGLCPSLSLSLSLSLLFLLVHTILPIVHTIPTIQYVFLSKLR